jgi:hypothetical protein
MEGISDFNPVYAMLLSILLKTGKERPSVPRTRALGPQVERLSKIALTNLHERI